MKRDPDKIHRNVTLGSNAESDTFEERWDDFEDEAMDDFWDAAWFESEDRRHQLQAIQSVLENGSLPSPLDHKEIISGLKEAIGYFSKYQLEELNRLIEHSGEGIQIQEDREAFEKSSKTELKEEVLGATSDVSSASKELFDRLLTQFYEIVARFALGEDQSDEALKAIIKVAWTSLQECSDKIKSAVRAGKPFSHIELLVFPFRKQLDALNPEHPFKAT